MKFVTMIATLMGVGHIRPAPGTWGSFFALPWAWLVHILGGFPLLMIGTIAAFFMGWWATSKMTEGSDNQDPSEIVIDELVGQWIALMPLSFAAWDSDIPIHVMWPGWIAAFALFRLFDVWKPWIIGRADKRGDALGVMLDDVFAGIFSAIGVIITAAVAHRLFTG